MVTATLSGGDKLEQKLAEIAARVARPATLRVGFLEGATYPDGTSVPMIAALMNFGSPAGKIPARPFFSKMIAEKAPGWGKILADLLEANDWDVNKCLALMGTGIAGQLRQAIVDMNEPANSPVTALLKNRFPMGDYGPEDVWQAYSDAAAGLGDGLPSKPLVWTGTMLNSVDYEVAG